ncbi:CaiB/BaiF CoA transferase family protein [Aliikangiella coralliicola]|uniref:CoA transferase n=1 Tax=Aliikangiella coralliicola TaxID=2592383 RepID=A0A545UK65_9GAMM|nr:CaiB/BaiF CoA-transferase family protein [Aliikangiella coralliicola]TQV89851.1 CoA transferase [Aliikangiella coralliicola]
MTTNQSTSTKGLLAGIKVLDLSRILAGPWATQLLADYGATVWKIEKPECGDDTRSWGPPFLELGEEQISAYFLSANRGKYSLAIDISCIEGQSIIRRLVREADILVENFKVNGLKRYGLDYESLKQINPGLIYCSITGFGQDGPMAAAPGYDAMIQATGGLMSITGKPDSEGGEPTKVGVAVTDLMTGMYASTAILAALNHRNSGGSGQHIDLALLDTQVAMLANQAMNYLVSGNPPERKGNGHPNIVPYQTFKCQDGFIMLAVGNDRQFCSTCNVLGILEVSEDTRFTTNANRVIHRTELISILEQRFAENRRDFWLAELSREGVPCGPVNNVAEAMAHEQIQHRNMKIEIAGDNDIQIPLVANPVQFSDVDINYRVPPPKLGEHTEEILRDVLNVDEDELDNLKKSNSIS